MIRWNGEPISILIGETKKKISQNGVETDYYENFPPLKIRFLHRKRRWGNMFVIGQPRYGKSALSKHIVTLLSKHCRCCIFDVEGEWLKTITKYNLRNIYKNRLTDYVHVSNFTFKLSDFNSAGDWLAFGFDFEKAVLLEKLINISKKYYKESPELFLELLSQIPMSYKHGFIDNFVRISGVRVHSPMNNQSKTELINKFETIKGFFWNPKGDKRRIINFTKLWRNMEGHLIIDLFQNASLGENVISAYAGKILQQIILTVRDVKRVPWLFVFEEARLLCPAVSVVSKITRSQKEIRDMVTRFPKRGIKTLFICQNENQIDKLVLDNSHFKIIGRVETKGEGKEYKYVADLYYDPDKQLRDFVLKDVTHDIFVFSPCEPVCLVESDF